MTTKTPIQEFASQNNWDGGQGSAQVWRYENGWEKVLEHFDPYDAIAHFVYESHLHSTMIVMTGIAIPVDDDNEEIVGGLMRVRIFVYIDKGSLDYKTGFEINGEIDEDANCLDGAYIEMLNAVMSKRDVIVEAKRLWDESEGE